MTNTADRIKFDNEMKKLAEGAYKGNEKSVPKDWINFAADDNPETGFHAEAFFKNDTIVISFRGTEMRDRKDWENDKDMVKKKLPSQYVDAQKFYKKIKKDFPTLDIVFTGHSLGGSLAQLMGNLTGCETVTFNAYGVGDLLQGNINDYLDIRNYGNSNDRVFTENINNHLGKIYTINKNVQSNYISRSYTENESKKYWTKYHFIDTMGDLEDAVEYKPNYIQGGVSMDIEYKDIDPKRVFTNEEIGKMPKEEYSRLESFILQQLASGDVMPKAKADEKLKYGYLIWVEPYVRTDGTQVSGYYRRR